MRSVRNWEIPLQRERMSAQSGTTEARQADESARPLDQTEESASRKKVELALRLSEESLRAILETAVDAIVTIDRSGIILSANPASERMFGYTAEELVGQNVSLLMPSPYREDHDGYLARYLQTGERHIIGIGREVQVRRKDGRILPVELAVGEIDHLQRFTGILRDLTRRKSLEREVVEIASLEQRRIGEDLHDSVGQELTALNLLAGDLAELVPADQSDAGTVVAKIVEGLSRCKAELRHVIRGLLPVPVDTLGLMAALSDLAGRTESQGGVACTFDCPENVSVADNIAATHLYLIAQEAVHNALKHARPRLVRIGLSRKPSLTLEIEDDGVGLPPPAEIAGETGGVGLRIMQNRAAVIGATLSIERVDPTGTRIVCTLPR